MTTNESKISEHSSGGARVLPFPTEEAVLRRFFKEDQGYPDAYLRKVLAQLRKEHNGARLPGMREVIGRIIAVVSEELKTN